MEEKRRVLTRRVALCSVGGRRVARLAPFALFALWAVLPALAARWPYWASRLGRTALGERSWRLRFAAALRSGRSLDLKNSKNPRNFKFDCNGIVTGL